MLAKRIIPCLDVTRSGVVKGTRFENLRSAGRAVRLASRYRDEGADEIVFLDVSATEEGRGTLLSLARKVASVLDIPFTIGGGIRSVQDAREALCNGADKVSVNTAAVKDPDLIKKLSDTFGSQCVVVAIDAKKENNDYFVYISSGRIRTGIRVADWARKAEELGAGELLVTSIDMDGTKQGYDIELIRMVSSCVSIPVIASGGCGRLEHFYDLFKKTGCDAALAASVFHFGELKIMDVKEYLFEKGVHVRI